MNIATVFEIGQTVFQIALDSERIWETCTACEGEGNVTLHDESLLCPKCHGRGGQHVWKPKKWHVHGPFQIGQVGVVVRRVRPSEGMIADERCVCRDGLWYEEEYMLVQTGIGTGTAYQQSRLFATDEEAQAVADQNNRVGKNFEKRR